MSEKDEIERLAELSEGFRLEMPVPIGDFDKAKMALAVMPELLRMVRAGMTVAHDLADPNSVAKPELLCYWLGKAEGQLRRAIRENLRDFHE